ncbi:DUF2182 domain-containing protein [Marinobacter halodurans]|uniref:DUF2182 domain-containing protein n=1 Tax=Marinobacter halodurans TaxID=2528979 RepID=A0ABY1ZMZ5_9GAMM|nr:DUF2182 domain-containing protein [Marinobacter halodurans]TBW57704.1 DUF2182 domain-containing protein [Marinobacter halodurans]
MSPLRTDPVALSHRLDRASVWTLAALALVVLLSWWYLVDRAAGMDAGMTMGGMLTFHPWTPAYAVVMGLMWSIMMMAMMLPSATPMILLYRRVALHNRLPRIGLGTLLFAAGYIIVWLCFSVIATGSQWALEQWAILSPSMRSQSGLFSGLVLILAGLYQWSPWKTACLAHCRGPAAFVMHHWRPGTAGALRMGLAHGAYCLGCCWALMALLFVGGVMDLLVIAGLTVLVLLEKVLPGGDWLAKGVGALVAVVGGWLLLGNLV